MGVVPPRSEESSGRTVLVTVGTDHHRFERLMGWVEQWLSTAPADVRVVVQHGPARCPAGAIGLPVVPHEEFLELLAEVDVVVTQGGPSTITEALVAGRRPLAVPRLRRLHEVVDNHQFAFCRRLEASDLVWIAETQLAFSTCLDAMLADPTLARAQVSTDHVAGAVLLAGGLIDQLVADRQQHLRPALGWGWRTRLGTRGTGAGRP